MSERRRLASNTVRLLVIGSLVAGDLAGCANGGNMFSSGVDKSDACGVQHRDFADSQNYYMSETLAGGITGALGGAAMGALLAAATGGNIGRGAAIGAGTGAVAGAYAGYWNAKQKDYQDQVALTNSVYDDVKKASTQLDHTDHAFALLKQCRFEQAALIKAYLKDHTITRDQANAMLADQRKRFTDELALAKKYGAKMADQDQSFRFAAGNIAKDDPDAQAALNAPKQATASGGSPTATGTFTVAQGINVRKAPDAHSQLVGALYPGAQVQAPQPADANGWRQITFNGGSQGYVMDKFLTPGGAAAPTAVAAAPAPAVESADKKVAVAQVTETIPEKREHYDKSVADADKDSAIAFNLDSSSSG
jgi:outer membrane lipoprotein SlyB